MYQTMKRSPLAIKLFLIHTNRVPRGMDVSKYEPKGIQLSCDLHSMVWLKEGGWTLMTHIKRTKPVKMLA